MQSCCERESGSTGRVDVEYKIRRPDVKTRRTPWWQYVIGAVLGLLAGIGLASYGGKFRVVADWCAMDCDRVAGRAGHHRAGNGLAGA